MPPTSPFKIGFAVQLGGGWSADSLPAPPQGLLERQRATLLKLTPFPGQPVSSASVRLGKKAWPFQPDSGHACGVYLLEELVAGVELC